MNSSLFFFWLNRSRFSLLHRGVCSGLCVIVFMNSFSVRTSISSGVFSIHYLSLCARFNCTLKKKVRKIFREACVGSCKDGQVGMK